MFSKNNHSSSRKAFTWSEFCKQHKSSSNLPYYQHIGKTQKLEMICEMKSTMRRVQIYSCCYADKAYTWQNNVNYITQIYGDDEN